MDLDGFIQIITDLYGFDWIDLTWMLPPGILGWKHPQLSSSNSIHHLVGGWATPLKNMTSSVGMIRHPILMGK